jgi:hypothetical protein
MMYWVKSLPSSRVSAPLSLLFSPCTSAKKVNLQRKVSGNAPFSEKTLRIWRAGLSPKISTAFFVCTITNELEAKSASNSSLAQ